MNKKYNFNITSAVDKANLSTLTEPCFSYLLSTHFYSNNTETNYNINPFLYPLRQPQQDLMILLWGYRIKSKHTFNLTAAQHHHA